MIDLRPLDFDEQGAFQSCVDLAKKSYPGEDDFSEILKHVVFDSHKNSFVLGAFDGGRLVGMNAFIAHPVCLEGRTSLAYQSCVTANDPDYRGRGIFVNLINESKKILLDDGASFLFGYPNGMSGPIFKAKLGFDERPLSLVYLPLAIASVYPKAFFNISTLLENVSLSSNRITFDARATAEWKESMHGPKIFSFEHYTNFIFGVVGTRRYKGISVRIFSVGGYEINKPLLIGRLLRMVQKGTKASIIRFIEPESGCIASSSRYVRPGVSTEPLITYSLNWDLHQKSVDAWTGLKDVY